jgi:serine/threonine protein kinase
MIDTAETWLNSGEYAEIAGNRLRPIESRLLKGTPLVTVRGQAQAFYLQDDCGLEWILKKFSPAKIPDRAYINAIQPLIPKRAGFQAGYLRKVLMTTDVAPTGFYNAQFALWIENAVLMSRIKSDDWAGLADKLRSGSVVLNEAQRVSLCKGLTEHVKVLERHQLSHRDLSSTNIFAGSEDTFVHLIDWECIFHPTLAMPSNTVSGTEGYIAPFVKHEGQADPQMTWRERADRFSLAILNAEFLSMRAGSTLQHDGGMFDQLDLCRRSGGTVDTVRSHLRHHFSGAHELFERALQAQDFDDCPAPDEWLVLFAGWHARVRAASTERTTVPSDSTFSPNSAAIVLLDESAFVPLDTKAMVQLRN